MIAHSFRIKILICLCLVSLPLHLFSQEDAVTEVKASKAYKTEFYNIRGTNAIDVAVGTSVINGDYVDPMFEIYSHIGYKRHITPHFAIDVGYHKFNLAYIDLYNEGFMSFDANLELTLLPHSNFSPFVFAGGGLNASNHFKATANKFQAGGGLEYIVSYGFGIKLYTDYNYVLSDELDGLEAGASDDTYFRIALGLNFYFGGAQQKAKKLKGQATVIDSNLLNDKYYSKK